MPLDDSVDEAFFDSEVERRTPTPSHVQTVVRPRTRGDCVNGPRPCPETWCRHHLDHERESCVLDVADRGEQTQEIVGELVGVSKQRIDVLESTILAKLRRKRTVREMADDFEMFREFVRPVPEAEPTLKTVKTLPSMVEKDRRIKAMRNEMFPPPSKRRLVVIGGER